jgi:ATP-binding cassette subfamily F protein 2
LYDVKVNFRFPDPDDLFATVVKIDGVSFSYNQKYCIFKDINLELKKYSRIALVGNNGTGKSTFLKLMTGQIQPDAGDIIQKDFSRIGVYNQHFQENMDESMSPI